RRADGSTHRAGISAGEMGCSVRPLPDWCLDAARLHYGHRMMLPRLAPLLVAAALLVGCDRAPWEATSNAPPSQGLPPRAQVLPPGAASAQATSPHVALGV